MASYNTRGWQYRNNFHSFIARQWDCNQQKEIDNLPVLFHYIFPIPKFQQYAGSAAISLVDIICEYN